MRFIFGIIVGIGLCFLANSCSAEGCEKCNSIEKYVFEEIQRTTEQSQYIPDYENNVFHTKWYLDGKLECLYEIQMYLKNPNCH